MTLRTGDRSPGRPARPALAAWGGGVLLYVALRLGRERGLLPEFLADHGADLVCLPLVLGLILALQRIRSGDRALVLPRRHGGAVLLLFAAWFELLLPRLDAGSTGDLLDVAAYTAGWVFFETVANRPRL